MQAHQSPMGVHAFHRATGPRYKTWHSRGSPTLPICSCMRHTKVPSILVLPIRRNVLKYMMKAFSQTKRPLGTRTVLSQREALLGFRNSCKTKPFSSSCSSTGVVGRMSGLFKRRHFVSANSVRSYEPSKNGDIDFTAREPAFKPSGGPDL